MTNRRKIISFVCAILFVFAAILSVVEDGSVIKAICCGVAAIAFFFIGVYYVRKEKAENEKKGPHQGK